MPIKGRIVLRLASAGHADFGGVSVLWVLALRMDKGQGGRVQDSWKVVVRVLTFDEALVAHKAFWGAVIAGNAEFIHRMRRVCEQALTLSERLNEWVIPFTLVLGIWVPKVMVEAGGRTAALECDELRIQIGVDGTAESVKDKGRKIERTDLVVWTRVVGLVEQNELREHQDHGWNAMRGRWWFAE